MSETTPRNRTITRSSRLPVPIHAVLMGDAPDREHRASALCWCHPEAILRDLASGTPIYRHWPVDR